CSGLFALSGFCRLGVFFFIGNPLESGTFAGGQCFKQRSDRSFIGAFHVGLNCPGTIDDRLLHVRVLEQLAGFLVVDDTFKAGIVKLENGFVACGDPVFIVNIVFLCGGLFGFRLIRFFSGVRFLFGLSFSASAFLFVGLLVFVFLFSGVFAERLHYFLGRFHLLFAFDSCALDPLISFAFSLFGRAFLRLFGNDTLDLFLFI